MKHPLVAVARSILTRGEDDSNVERGLVNERPVNVNEAADAQSGYIEQNHDATDISSIYFHRGEPEATMLVIKHVTRLLQIPRGHASCLSAL